MSPIFLQETTEWEGDTPNHVYIVENMDSFKAIGYIPQGQSLPIYFSVPMMFDKRNRTFKKVTSLYIDSLSSV